VVGLQPCREPSGKTNRCAEARNDANLAGDCDKILHAHQFGDSGSHLRHQAGRKPGERLRIALIREQCVAELAHSKARDGRERGRIVTVKDQSRDLICLVRDERLFEEDGERKVG
jgi:hypothetical protein